MRKNKKTRRPVKAWKPSWKVALDEYLKFSKTTKPCIKSVARITVKDPENASRFMSML